MASLASAIDPQSATCQCGRAKLAGRALCWDCWRRLLSYMQYEVGRGIYENALRWLNR